MKIACRTQNRLRTRLAAHQRRCRSRQHFAQADAAIETVRGFGQVSTRVLGLTHRTTDPVQRPLGVGKYRVHPARTARFGGRHAVSYSQHNGRGQPGRIVGVNGEAVEYDYDARGRVRQLRSFRNSGVQTTQYAYADSGLLDAVSTPGGGATRARVRAGAGACGRARAWRKARAAGK